MSQKGEIIVCIESIKYESDGFVIAQAEANGNWFTVKGNTIEPFEPEKSYRLLGRWEDNEFRGEIEQQFVFTAATPSEPIGKGGVIRYMQSVQGIGPKVAKALWDAFGEEVLHELREGDESNFVEVFGKLPDWFADARHFFTVNKEREVLYTQLAELLDGRGFPKTTKGWAIRQWSINAPDVIRADPFNLLHKPGIGFGRCDQMWFALGKSPDDPIRQMHCATHAVVLCDNDSWVRDTVVPPYLHDMMTNSDWKQATRDSIDAGWLDKEYTDSDGDLHWDGERRWLAVGVEARAERSAANDIADAVNESVMDPMEQGGWSNHQFEQIGEAMAAPSAIKIVTGYAGSGKSYSIAVLVQSFLEEYGPGKVALCAPTGKAAVRMTEAMSEYGIQLQASTIHSLLGFSPNGWHHNRENPLPYNVVIIDEFSMVTTSLASSLFAARASGTLFIITGDTAQLLPVGRGAPLRDMIDSGAIPHAHLTEVHRNDGELLIQCNRLRDGKSIEFTAGSNLELRNVGPSQITTEIISAIDEWAGHGETMVITPKNLGEFGRKELNRALQNHINKCPEVDNSPFRVADRVINRKNGWVRCTEAAEGTLLMRGKNEFITAEAGEQYTGCKVYSANGDMGTILDCETKKMTIELQSPRRIVHIGRGIPEEQAEDDRDCYLENEKRPETGCNFELAWCISGHLSQGAQWPVVIVVLDATASRFVGRNWLYTAMTRASKHCILVGDPRTAHGWSQSSVGAARKTFLRERIIQETERRQVIAPVAVEQITAASEASEAEPLNAIEEMKRKLATL